MSVVSDIITAIFSPLRHLGPIVAQVTIEEHHRDDLIITQHPVELGAPITDHSYKLPSEVIIHCGWSYSGIANLASISSIASLIGSSPQDLINYTRGIYTKLLQLQESRSPFDIVTGKRSYSNMLFKSLSTTTDQTTENSLIVTAVCQQIIIVQTQLTTVPPRGVQQNPQATAPVENLGQKQAQPGNSINLTSPSVVQTYVHDVDDSGKLIKN